MVKFCKSQKCLIGKTAIITGANTGIGYETALDFAKRGGRVILACRNYEKANNARQNIVEITGNQNVVVKILNMESLTSVRQFALDVNSSEDRLDILVNNAGAGDLPEQLTDDGLQLEMAVNYFSSFLLTNLLLDLLKKSAPSRIVNVSSALASLYCGKFNLENLNKPDKMMYCKTKLCNIYFTQELAKRLEGTGVTTYSLHPGVVRTEFMRFNNALNFIAKLFLTPEEGAQTQIYLSVQDGIEHLNGRHFENCEAVKNYGTAKNKEIPKKLWEISEEMVGLKDNDKIINDDKITDLND